MKMLKCVGPELIRVAHQTALHMVQEALHNKRHEVLCCSDNYVTIICNQEAAGSHLVFEEIEHAELGQTLCWSQNMASDCGGD
jgi:hypothetical protein